MSSGLGRAWHVRRKKSCTMRSIILSAPSSYKSGVKFSVDHKRPPRWYQKSEDLIFNSTEIQKPQQFSITPLGHTPSSSCCRDPGVPFWYWRKAPRVLLLQGWTLCSTNGPLILNLTHALHPERDGRVSRWLPVRRHHAASWVAGWGGAEGRGCFPVLQSYTQRSVSKINSAFHIYSFHDISFKLYFSYRFYFSHLMWENMFLYMEIHAQNFGLSHWILLCTKEWRE